MAAELKDALGVEAELVEGRGGVFDVTVDGRVVYSKDNTHRFPDDGEVLGLVRG